MLTIRDLLSGINLAQVQANDKLIDRATIKAGGSVAANVTTPVTVQVSKKGVFVCMAITGRFTTLTAGPTDNGVCALSMTWQNSSGRVYIDQPVYLDELFTPGRVKSSLDAAGAVGNQMQFPGLDWVAVFQPGDMLTFNVQNEATYANTWQIVLHGFWVKG